MHHVVQYARLCYSMCYSISLLVRLRFAMLHHAISYCVGYAWCASSGMLCLFVQCYAMHAVRRGACAYDRNLLQCCALSESQHNAWFTITWASASVEPSTKKAAAAARDETHWYSIVYCTSHITSLQRIQPAAQIRFVLVGHKQA